MLIQDINFYPRKFTALQVLSLDATGKPTLTVFYRKRNNNTDEPELVPVFYWDQTWSESGVCMSWEVTIIRNEE